MLKRLLCIIAITIVAGCAVSNGPPPPSYADAFAGLYNQAATTVSVDAPVTVQQPVAILFSNNVEKWFQYVKENNAYWASVIPASLTNIAAVADNDPNFIGGRVLEMLKRRYPNSEYVSDFPKAVASGKRSAVLVDVIAKAMEPHGDRTTHVDITLYFFDSNMNPVSRVSGHGEYRVAFAEMTGGIQRSVDSAIADLEKKLNTIVR